MISRVGLIRKDKKKFRSARKIPPSGKQPLALDATLERQKNGSDSNGVPNTMLSTRLGRIRQRNLTSLQRLIMRPALPNLCRTFVQILRYLIDSYAALLPYLIRQLSSAHEKYGV